MAARSVDPELVVEVARMELSIMPTTPFSYSISPKRRDDGAVALLRARDRVHAARRAAREAVAGIDAVAGDVVGRTAAVLHPLAPVPLRVVRLLSSGSKRLKAAWMLSSSPIVPAASSSSIFAMAG